VTIEIAAKRPKTTPANKTPRPSEIQRALVVCGGGETPTRSHMNIRTIPTKPRKIESVSTSDPSAKTILLRTLQMAKDEAATTPGRRSAIRGDEEGGKPALTIRSLTVRT
jgi:hypothetical protein